MKKGTKLYSILKLKCPRCQIGDLFIKPGLFVFSRIFEMPNKCSCCKQNFKLEPGFYTPQPRRADPARAVWVLRLSRIAS